MRLRHKKGLSMDATQEALETIEHDRELELMEEYDLRQAEQELDNA